MFYINSAIRKENKKMKNENVIVGSLPLVVEKGSFIGQDNNEVVYYSCYVDYHGLHVKIKCDSTLKQVIELVGEGN